MAADQPPSPSPPPSAPTQVTPGPRASAFADLYSKALGSTLKACSYENFAACFPTPAGRTPKVLRAVWEQITGKVESKGREEFEGILTEREVVQGLNQLEALLAEARGRREAGRGREGEVVAPHTLPPTDLLAAHLAPHLAPVQAELESKLRAAQARNEQLAEALRTQRAEIERIVAGLEAAVEDVEGANAVLDEAVESRGADGKSLRIEAKELRADVAAMEVDLRL